MILAMILVPVVASVLAILIRRADGLRRTILILAALGHTALVVSAWLYKPSSLFNGYLRLDEPGMLFLSITSVLFLMSAMYAVGYLRKETQGDQKDFEENIFFSNTPEAVFTACLLMFLATMTLVTASQHLGLLWVAVEATTLASAPLIYFHRHHRSLEATWKYLLICSVGIALALLGNFFLVAAASNPADGTISLLLSDLISHGKTMNTAWLKAAFLLFLVGYGTKMGLAPLHTWLPDAHSESPSVVSALLSGALLNCAFLGILRAMQVCSAAGLEKYSHDLLILFGLFSIAWAAVFIFGQADYKRMLAYSSVEHMGVLAFGVGLDGSAVFGAMLHAVNHSLTKAMLFMVAGNILAAYKTKSTADVRGVLRVLPISGLLWIAGFLAITGVPPFGIFLSEFTITKAVLDQGRSGMAVAFLGLLALVFIGMSNTILKMAQGRPSESLKIAEANKSESFLSILPPVILGILILMGGLYIPPSVTKTLHEVAGVLGGF
jgi:hydrogenase-4 component F